VFKPCFIILSLSLVLIFAGCETVKPPAPEKKKPAKKKIVPAPVKKDLKKPEDPKYPTEPEVILPGNAKNSEAVSLPREPEMINSASQKKNESWLLLPNKDASRFLSSDAFVSKWKILGPFSFSLEDVKTANEAIHKDFVPKEQDITGDLPAPKGVFWKYYEFKDEKPMGCVDLNKLFGSEEISNLVLYAGGSDFMKIWINGKLVHAYNKEPRKGDIDQDTIKGVKLLKGVNNILVKVVKVSGEWSFYFRFATEDNIPVRIIR
jgi:hypothetical protein